MKRVAWWTLAIVTIVAVFVLWQMGVYTVQPLGALPDGKTLIVWRAEGEPFFDSPDGRCLRRTGGVSLLCRLAALRAAPADRIVLRLPYQRWAYLRSTGGQEFDR